MNQSPNPEEEGNDGLSNLEVLRGGQCQTLVETCVTYMSLTYITVMLSKLFGE